MKNRKNILMLLLAAVMISSTLFSGCKKEDDDDEPQKATIIVIEKLNGSFIEGANATISKSLLSGPFQVKYTDANGKVEFTGLDAGTYIITGGYTDSFGNVYGDTESGVTVAAGETTTVNLTLN